MDTVASIHLSPAAIAGIAIGVVVLWALLTYNRLVRLRNEADQGFANIDAQLKRRADLIPNLVEVVKGYAAHESSTFSAVTAAREATMMATTPAQVAMADQLMQQASRKLLAVAEAYPDLKASQNFQALQEQLSETEDRIAGARRMFNVVVQRFNTLIQQLPSNLVAKVGRFAPRDLYRIEDDAEREVVPVNLGGGA